MRLGNGADTPEMEERQEMLREEDQCSEPLPPGWERHFDESQSAWPLECKSFQAFQCTSRLFILRCSARYFWHNTSGRSQWQRPEESETDEMSSRVTTPKAEPKG